MSHVKLLVVGAGNRGVKYSTYASLYPEAAKIVAVAEPRDFQRHSMAEIHCIAKENVFTDWQEAAEREKLADAVVITTQDKMHLEPVKAFAAKHYHILLEKPMATDEQSCKEIEAISKSNGIILGICHVLRYSNYTQKIKELIDSGVIGEVVNIQRLEPIGYWHYAHSYVRGNWRDERVSSSLILAKSCHDLDWIRYIMGCKCKKISSFGSLFLFRKDKKPKDAGQRCVDCKIEAQCPYSAKKIYFGFLNEGVSEWPVYVVTDDPSREGLMKSLRQGPYGQCVYQCDNNVLDNQIVNMEFEGGKTASLILSAFTEHAHRKTRILGTRGRIEGDGSRINLLEFLNDKETIIDIHSPPPGPLGGHGGGDYNLIKNFVESVRTGDPTKIYSNPQESLESHLMAFAAEKARLNDIVVKF